MLPPSSTIREPVHTVNRSNGQYLGEGSDPDVHVSARGSYKAKLVVEARNTAAPVHAATSVLHSEVSTSPGNAAIGVVSSDAGSRASP